MSSAPYPISTPLRCEPSLSIYPSPATVSEGIEPASLKRYATAVGASQTGAISTFVRLNLPQTIRPKKASPKQNSFSLNDILRTSYRKFTRDKHTLRAVNIVLRSAAS